MVYVQNEKLLGAMEKRLFKILADLEEAFTGIIEVIEARMDALEQDTDSLKSKVLSRPQENHELRINVEIMEVRMNHLNRRNNIICYGLPENDSETRSRLHENLNKFIRESMEID
ncbi:unnamed protein product, partial [Allacma fusca]